MAVEVGQTAPNFTLFDTDRKRRQLSEFKGQNVVLAFFPGAFTGVCTKEMCTLRDQLDQYRSMNAQILGISVDPPFSQKAWLDQNKISFPLLSDFNRQVVNQYGVTLPGLAGLEGYIAAQRSVFVVDKGGVVRYKWVSATPANEPNYDEVRQAVAQLG
jgi:peroxiredoxin